MLKKIPFFVFFLFFVNCSKDKTSDPRGPSSESTSQNKFEESIALVKTTCIIESHHENQQAFEVDLQYFKILKDTTFHFSKKSETSAFSNLFVIESWSNKTLKDQIAASLPHYPSLKFLGCREELFTK